jgi:hypothetical protein
VIVAADSTPARRRRRRRQAFRAALDDVLLQLEAGNAVDQQPARPVVAVIDVHLVAAPAQPLGRGQPARAGADDADRLAQLAPAAGFTQPRSQAVSVM